MNHVWMEDFPWDLLERRKMNEKDEIPYVPGHEKPEAKFIPVGISEHFVAMQVKEQVRLERGQEKRMQLIEKYMGRARQDVIIPKYDDKEIHTPMQHSKRRKKFEMFKIAIIPLALQLRRVNFSHLTIKNV